MTLLWPAQKATRRWRTRRRGHLIPIAVSGLIATSGWRWWRICCGRPGRPTPPTIPGDAGQRRLNAVQRAGPCLPDEGPEHTGPQERVDLFFLYPSLEAPEAPKHVSADTVDDAIQPIDRIFLSITAHHDVMAPEIRLRTIYPRYLIPPSTAAQDGLNVSAFRDGSPYSSEDLYVADTPNLAARCTRDAATPGMCLSERRIDGADLTFRLSTRLVGAMARCRRRDGPPDRTARQSKGLRRKG